MAHQCKSSSTTYHTQLRFFLTDEGGTEPGGLEVADDHLGHPEPIAAVAGRAEDHQDVLGHPVLALAATLQDINGRA